MSSDQRPQASLRIMDSRPVVDDVPAMFPAVTAVGTDLLVSFSTVPDGWPGGRIGLVRSTDGGRTWSRPEFLAGPDETSEAALGAVSMTTTATGRVLLPYNRVSWVGDGVDGRRISAHLISSDDGGRTWSAERRVAADFHGPAIYGRLLPTADGRILLPVWGQRREGDRWQAALYVSADDGATFTWLATVAHDPTARLTGAYAAPTVSGETADGRPDLSATTDPDFRPHAAIDGFNEFTVVEDGDRLVAVLRQQGVGGDDSLQLFTAESVDGGRTWSPYAKLGFAGMSPCLHRRPSGRFVLAYRRATADGSAPGVELRLSDGVGRPWSDPIELEYPDGQRPTAEYQCGYPALTELPDGTLLVVFYGYRRDHGRYLVSNRLGPA